MTSALVFSGQGAQQPDMLDGLRACASFTPRYEAVCAALKLSPLEELARGNKAVLNHNAVSSLMTVLAGVMSLERYRAAGEAEPAFVAGYSVGQWTALYAAGVVPFAMLIDVVHQRSRFMDQAIRRTPGAMLGVIGLPAGVVEELCEAVRASTGEYVAISNENAVGQFSLAGTTAAIDAAEARLETTQARKVVRLPVSGAWHCALMDEAAEKFGRWLEGVALSPPKIPVTDNVTGEFLPNDAGEFRQRLVEHVRMPVRWQNCVKTLIAAGTDEIVEVGYGNLLTKFGFFIDRSVRHRAFYNSTESAEHVRYRRAV